MSLQYEEWLPGPGLVGVVTAYWRVLGDGSNVPYSAVLPDGHVELVFNLGDPVGLAGPSVTGEQPDRAVVGPLSKTVQLQYRGPVNTFGVRFHPARGAGFLRQPATVLTDKVVPLAQLCPRLDRALAGLLADRRGADAEVDRAALENVLLAQQRLALPVDADVVALVDRLIGPEGPTVVADVAHELGLSSRQLQRRFVAAVGMPPKRFMRVIRFARVWQLASMRPPETWADLAVEQGYADQAHMIKEFRAFGAEPPTRLFTPDWYDATELSRVSGPAADVRFVQDPARTRAE